MNSRYIDEFQASFYVLGGDIPPSEITKQLQTQPDLVQVKGESRSSLLGNSGKLYTENLWRFSSPLTPDDDQKADSHIEFILQSIEPHNDFLLHLPTHVELHLEITCSLNERYRSTGYPIDVSLLARLVKLRICMSHVFRLAVNDPPDT
jgi:Domain of unknown function (DUF4279)